MFECLVGYPPFCSENAHDTYRKIIDWKNQLYFPDDVRLSRESEDLIRRLVVVCVWRVGSEELTRLPRRMIVGHETRLGRNSADEIKNHPFFAGVDWTTIRNIESPFIPQLRCVSFDVVPRRSATDLLLPFDAAPSPTRPTSPPRTLTTCPSNLQDPSRALVARISPSSDTLSVASLPLNPLRRR